jgi:indole-3-glycerol phosphate synthase
VSQTRLEEKNVLVVDSGDLFFKPRAIGSVESHRARANLIGKAFLRMKADAINIGMKI